MKIYIGQINTRVGDIRGNSEKMISTIAEARRQNADLVVFPELAIIGYPPEDLVEKKPLIDANLQALEHIARSAEGLGAIVGYADYNRETSGNRLYNAAALVSEGKILARYYKVLLPNYDVFDERRHFEPGRQPLVMQYHHHRLAVTLCEDAWNDKDFWKHRLYQTDPIETLMQQGADVLINLSASPFHAQKAELRLNIFQSISRKYHIPSVMVNLVGGNDSLIFDGSGFALNSTGALIARAPSFEESGVLVDLQSSGLAASPISFPEEEEIYRALVLGLRDYMKKCGFRKCLIGLSGGIDSALVAVIAADALGPEQVTGIAMPSRYSSSHSIEDARTLAERLGIHFRLIPIEPLFEEYLKQLMPHFGNVPEDTTEENIQARIRGNYLMALSNKTGALVLSTGNKSELAVGYCTLYGDMCGGLSVISDVPKTMVYRIARWINRNGERIPERILTKPPSAELKPNQTDQDSLPPYELLDGIIRAYVEESKETDEIVALGYDKTTVERILRLIDRNEYKRRQAAPGLRVTTKAFGFGRRIPLAQGWR